MYLAERPGVRPKCLTLLKGAGRGTADRRGGQMPSSPSFSFLHKPRANVSAPPPSSKYVFTPICLSGSFHESLRCPPGRRVSECNHAQARAYCRSFLNPHQNLLVNARATTDARLQKNEITIPKIADRNFARRSLISKANYLAEFLRRHYTIKLIGINCNHFPH